MTKESYNYPIVQFPRYKEAGDMRGAHIDGKMSVEFALVARPEFIPIGATTGPTKEIYFKVLKAGSCGMVGGVCGWPHLDNPTPGGEGLGWTGPRMTIMSTEPWE